MIIKDTKFRVEKFVFNGFPTNQWIVQVHRTWDDGHGYKGNEWRNIGTETFNTEKDVQDWVKDKTLQNKEL